MYNKVVARYLDGRIVKGTTVDFTPDREVIHVKDPRGPDSAPPVAVRMRELKALFFVRSLEGDPAPHEPQAPNPGQIASSSVAAVAFLDGEVLFGTTVTYSPEKMGFFLEPLDDTANEERVYVINTSTRDVSFL